MNKQNFYSDQELPTVHQKQQMWESIEQNLSPLRKVIPLFHWKSFWIGNAAAILLFFAGIGVSNTIQNFSGSTTDEQVYETLAIATHQLQELTPLLIKQANEPNQLALKSTASAITEIDKLIEEMKTDIQINGSSPAKETGLKRLYATKLEFYKEILLNQGESS